MVTVVETRKTFTVKQVCDKLGLTEVEFGSLVFCSIPANQRNKDISSDMDKDMVFKFKKVIN